MDSLCICYNLVDNKFLDIPPLPEAYIVPTTNDFLGYVVKQATPQTLDSNQMEFRDTDQEELIGICGKLKISALEQRFAPIKRKKRLSFLDTIKDPKIKEVIQSYISDKLAIFFSIIAKNQYPVSLNAQRKDPFQNHRLKVATEPLLPILEFTKIEEGIEYAFSLKNETNHFIPKDHDIAIILNDPSHIILDKCIYTIKNLNANKLKPFFDKEKITIANKHLKIYLEKVIIPIIKNVDVITNGFEISTQNTIDSYKLEIVKDFIQELFVAKVVFTYNNSNAFDYNSKKTTISNILFAENTNKLQIVQTKRDKEAEEKIISHITQKGLSANTNLLFETESTTDSFEIINWLKSNKSELEKDGFEFEIPQIEGKSISTSTYSIELNTKKKMTGSI